MTSIYENFCDFCGLKTSGSSDDFDVRNNHWKVSIDNSWFEPEKDSPHYVLKQEVEIYKDACSDCAKKISKLIKSAMPNP